MARKTKATNSKAASVTPNSRSSRSRRTSKKQTSSSKETPVQMADGNDFPETISIQEKVALLAYNYWEERGRPGGSPDEDWFRAEKEILDQLSISRQ
jgi:hypothetical protein